MIYRLLIPTPHRQTLVSKFCMLFLFLAITTQKLSAAPLPNLQLEKGVFLVATNNLAGSSFEKTVILVTKYSKYGAMGLVINRPTTFKISDIFSSLKSAKAENKVYLGGPVYPKSVLILIKSTRPHSIPSIIGDVYFSGGQHTLERLIETEGTDDIVRVYAGYSGWMPGQLEAEIKRGDWLITKADKSFIFEADTKGLWQKLTKNWSGRWI